MQICDGSVPVCFRGPDTGTVVEGERSWGSTEPFSYVHLCFVSVLRIMYLCIFSVYIVVT